MGSKAYGMLIREMYVLTDGSIVGRQKSLSAVAEAEEDFMAELAL